MPTLKFFSVQSLKEICWGGANVIPKPDWIKSSLKMNEPDQLYAYGLTIDLQGSTKVTAFSFEKYQNLVHS